MGEGRSREKRTLPMGQHELNTGKARKDGGGCFLLMVFCLIREKKIIIKKNCSPTCRPIIINTVSAKGMEPIWCFCNFQQVLDRTAGK